MNIKRDFKLNLSRRDLLKLGGVAAPLISFPALFGVTLAQDEGDDVATMLNLAATAETLACTHYYAALTTGAIDFKDIDVVYLKAALDAELQHLELLNANGAAALTEEFYFPENTFTDKALFIAVTQALESAFIGAYLAATRRAAELGNPLLAMTAAQIAAVEAQHLALIRLTGDLLPPNNVALPQASFYTVSDAVPTLQPFLETSIGYSGPEYYFGAETMRALIGEDGVVAVLPALDPQAFPETDSE